jgi:hypothetical protein
VTQLQDLVIDEREFDQSELAEGLMGFVRLGNNGELRPGDGWDGLSERAKIIAVLLALKASAALQLRADDAGTALDISHASGVAYGTVRPTLRSLLQEHLVQQPARGRYAIPSMRVKQALRVLTLRRHSNGN